MGLKKIVDLDRLSRFKDKILALIPVLDGTLSKNGQAADAAAVGTALSNKVDKVSGKDLSSNDFTSEYKNRLDNLSVNYIDKTTWDDFIPVTLVLLSEDDTSGTRVLIFDCTNNPLFQNISKLATAISNGVNLWFITADNGNNNTIKWHIIDVWTEDFASTHVTLASRLQNGTIQWATISPVSATKMQGEIHTSSATENNFTNALLSKLNGIESGARANVQADWTATSGDAFILNKPNIPTVPTDVSAFTNDAGYLTETTVAASADNWLGDALAGIDAEQYVLVVASGTSGAAVTHYRGFVQTVQAGMSAKKLVCAFGIPKSASPSQLTDFDILAVAEARNMNLNTGQIEFGGISGGKLYSTVLSPSGNGKMTGTLSVTDLALSSATGVSF